MNVHNDVNHSSIPTNLLTYCIHGSVAICAAFTSCNSLVLCNFIRIIRITYMYSRPRHVMAVWTILPASASVRSFSSLCTSSRHRKKTQRCQRARSGRKFQKFIFCLIKKLKCITMFLFLKENMRHSVVHYHTSRAYHVYKTLHFVTHLARWGIITLLRAFVLSSSNRYFFANFS